MKNRLLLLSFVVWMILLCSCQKDLGLYVTTSIPVPEFKELKQDASVDIVLTQGARYNVSFEGFEDILADLSFNVIRGKLIITQHGHYWSSGKSTIFITVPDLSLIEITSSGNVEGSYRFIPGGPMQIEMQGSGDLDMFIDVERLTTRLDGSGDLRLRGYADNHDIEIDGSGRIYAYNLVTYKMRLNHFGSNQVEVNVANNLIVRLRGSGNVYFIGNPFLDYSVTGSGRLIDAN